MADTLMENQYFQHELIGRTIENFNKLSADRKTKFAVESRLVLLENYWTKFNNNHEEIMAKVPAEDRKRKDYFKHDLYQICVEDYLEAKSSLLKILSAIVPESHLPENHEQRVISTAASRSKALPKITLPTFGGEYRDWIPFRDLFLSLVGNSGDLSSVEKLHYLKSSLNGEAATLIGNIPITDENYDRAWTKIVARFENRRVLINAQLDILFNLKSVQRKCAKELEILRTTVAEVVESLEALGGPVQHWDYFLVYLICRRLDQESHEAWELSLGGSTEPPNYRDLDTFLEARMRALESVDAAASGSKPRSFNPGFSSRSQFSRSHVASSNSCACCGSGYFIASCATYQGKSPGQRRELVSSKKLCFNCLGRHPSHQCHSSKRCFECGQKHHTSLHGSLQVEDTRRAPTRLGRAQSSSAPDPSREGPSASVNDSSAVHHAATPQSDARSSQALLATAVVNVISPNGRIIQARALLDQGSQLSFVCESLAQALQLPRRHGSRALVGIGDQKHASTRGVTCLRIQNHCDSLKEYVVEAHILPRVTGRIPTYPVFTQNWSHLSGLRLADPSFAIPAPIDLLLGADIYGHLIEEELRKGASTDPVAQKTTLGWIVSGPTSQATYHHHTSSRSLCCGVDDELSELVERFWLQEEINCSSEKMLSKDEAKCEAHFSSTYFRDDDGRYIVRLPFKSELPNFGDSRSVAYEKYSS